MPILTVQGIPANIGIEELKKLWFALRSVVASIPELKLTSEQVTVFFPPDLLQEGLGEEIIITVTGLFVRPERTEEIRNILAKKLALIAKLYFPDAMVECLIIPFDPSQGFATFPRVLPEATQSG